MSESLLDALRQRVSQGMQNEGLASLGDFGAGMLANPSPNFFTMLGGGLRAQRTGEASRLEELRRVVEAERQEQARQDQAENEATRRRLEQERFTYERDPTNPQNRLVDARIREAQRGPIVQPIRVGALRDGTPVFVNPLTGQRLALPEGVISTEFMRGEERDVDRRARAALAAQTAAQRYAEQNPGMTPEQIRSYREGVERGNLASVGLEPLPPANGTPATGAATPSAIFQFQPPGSPGR
jgi:TolA-binding protein